MEDHVFRIINNGKTDLYRLNVDFNENGLNITILHNLRAWQANVEHRELKILSRKYETVITDYYTTLKTKFSGAPDNIFKLNSKEFVIYSIADDNLKIKYFDCELKEVNYNECVCNFMDKFYNDKIQVHKKQKVLEKENAELIKCKKIIAMMYIGPVERVAFAHAIELGV